MMRILLLGRDGQLGQDLQLRLAGQEEIKIIRKKIIQYQHKKEFRGIFFSSNLSNTFISNIIENLN